MNKEDEEMLLERVEPLIIEDPGIYRVGLMWI